VRGLWDDTVVVIASHCIVMQLR